jgi:hypothetical protein
MIRYKTKAKVKTSCNVAPREEIPSKEDGSRKLRSGRGFEGMFCIALGFDTEAKAHGNART